MKIIWMIVFLFSLGVTHGQQGFVKVFDTASIAQFHDVLIDNDTIILYSSTFNGNGIQGIEFLKMDTLGNILTKEFYTNNQKPLYITRYMVEIIHCQDDGYAIFVTNGTNPYLLKVHHDFNLDFLVKYPFSVDWAGNGSLLETADGFLLAGRQQNDGEDSDIYVIKTDKQGNQLWRKTYGDPDENDAVININQFDDNSFLLSGGIGEYMMWGGQGTWGRSSLIMIDTLGNKKWSWTAPSEHLSQNGIWDIELLPDSSWICISGTWELSPSGVTYWTRPIILRMDKDFNIIWEWIYWKLIPIQFLTDLERTPDGNFLASGWVDTYPDYTNLVTKSIHYKFTPEGDSLWMRLDSIYPDSIRNTNGMRTTGTAILSSGSIISVGYAQRNGYKAGVYGFVMKISPDGCIDTLNCWPVANTESFAEAEDIQVYPNPADDELTVFLPDAIHQKAHIYFYDVTGRFLRKQRVRSGRNLLSVSDLSKGMVFYTVLSEKGILRNGKLIKN